MKIRRRVFLGFLGFLFSSLLLPCKSFADKPSVKIEAPEVAARDTDIVIKIHVSHKGNNFLHYTDWVEVKINEEPVQRWVFTASDRPEAENFTREFSYKITEPVTIVAEANCNMHGGEGPATWAVGLASVQTDNRDREKESKP